MLIPDRWHAVLESKEVPRGKPFGIRRFGVPRLLARDNEDGSTSWRIVVPIGAVN